ncbi:hypothetical protein OH77DRAFT_1399250, partial [Trametes cingulata]
RNTGSTSDPWAIELPYWVPDDTRRRLRNFLSFSDNAISTYALCKLPLHSVWGPPPFSYILYDPAALRPVKIWVVGTVLEFTCTVSVGSTRSRTRLKMQLLRGLDADAADRLLSMGDARVRFGYDILEASRSEDSDDGRVTMFPEIFDARQSFRNKDQMRVISPSDIVGGDLVLAECLCTKVPHRRLPRKTNEARWSTSFSLLAISLLGNRRDEYPTNGMIVTTRRVSGYYYAAGHDIRPVVVPLQHFNFDSGVEQPLLDGILHGSSHIRRYILLPAGSDVSFTAYIAGKSAPSRADRARRRSDGSLLWDGDMVILRHAKFKRTFVNSRKDDRKRAGTVVKEYVMRYSLTRLLIPLFCRILKRHVCMTITVRVTETDAVFVDFTWQHFRSNAPRLPYQHYASVDAPRRTNTELYVPNDPFARPMILFTTRRSFYGVPGDVLLNAEVSQLAQRNVYRTPPLQLSNPQTGSAPEQQAREQGTDVSQQDTSVSQQDVTSSSSSDSL